MKKSFTLIELIVVIAIIAILATSGTLMLTKRFSSARDSSRKQSISQIGTALDVNMATQARFPTPENSSEVYDVSGALVWYQGVFGSSVADIITAIDSAPQDPNTNEYYGYSISYDKKQYQLKAELENEDTIAYLNSAYAADDTNKIAYVDGNYNGYILTYTGGKYYLYQLPSIFMKNEGLSVGSKIGSGTMEIINPGSKISNDVQVKVADITTLVNGTDDGTTKTKVAQDLGVDEGLLDKVIKNSAGSDITKSNNTTTTPSANPVDGVCGTNNGGTFHVAPSTNLCEDGSTPSVTDDGTNFNWTCAGSDGGADASCSATKNQTLYTSCNEILNNGASHGDDIYEIDPDGDTVGTQVYCDMSTNGGGRTRILYKDPQVDFERLEIRTNGAMADSKCVYSATNGVYCDYGDRRGGLQIISIPFDWQDMRYKVRVESPPAGSHIGALGLRNMDQSKRIVSSNYSAGDSRRYFWDEQGPSNNLGGGDFSWLEGIVTNFVGVGDTNMQIKFTSLAGYPYQRRFLDYVYVK